MKLSNNERFYDSLFQTGFLWGEDARHIPTRVDPNFRTLQGLECQNLSNACAKRLWAPGNPPGEANLWPVDPMTGIPHIVNTEHVVSQCDSCAPTSLWSDSWSSGASSCCGCIGRPDLWAGANESPLYPFYAVPLIYDQTNLAQAWQYPTLTGNSVAGLRGAIPKGCPCARNLKVV
jgi:hypothetical protein